MSAAPSFLDRAVVSVPVADPARLAAVGSYRLTGHDGVPELDAVVTHAAGILDVPIAVINLVGPSLQCYPAEHGVGAPRTHVPDAVSFCAYVVADRAPIVVADTRSHPVFAANPLVRAGKISAYAGVPLIDEDGFALGALSVFDDTPREFTDQEVGVLQTLSGLVRVVLSLRRRVTAHEWDARLLVARRGQPIKRRCEACTRTTVRGAGKAPGVSLRDGLTRTKRERAQPAPPGFSPFEAVWDRAMGSQSMWIEGSTESGNKAVAARELPARSESATRRDSS